MHQQQGQCHSGCALPVGPCSPSVHCPLHSAWVSWPCHSLLLLLFKMPSGSSRSPCSSLCSGLKLLHSNFFFHFISGRALELCCLPLAPSSPPSELLPGPVSFPGVPSCSQLVFNPLLFCPLLQCSYPEDRSHTTSSAIHLPDPKPLSQCDKCDLLIVWRGSPGCKPLLGSVAIPWHQPQGQTYKGGCSCLAHVGTTVSVP